MATESTREYLRHTIHVPLEVEQVSGALPEQQSAVNVSHGGLAFVSRACPAVGDIVSLRIAVVTPPFEAQARVVWCRPEGGNHLVGVEFLDAGAAFRSRMVQQVCSIENYRREVQAQEGRVLSTQEAAAEWIARYAGRFPDADVAYGEDG